MAGSGTTAVCLHDATFAWRSCDRLAAVESRERDRVNGEEEGEERGERKGEDRREEGGEERRHISWWTLSNIILNIPRVSIYMYRGRDFMWC